MFAGIREYLSLAPARPQDRWAILASYIAVPYALYPAFMGSYEAFFALVPVGLFLALPALLSMARRQAGLLDSMGRILFGVVLYVFCAAHIGLLVHEGVGRLELFGVLALAAELPLRVAGRPRPGEGFLRQATGVVLGAGLAALAGWVTAPLAGLSGEFGVRAGLLVLAAVACGSMVADAVAEDLSLGAAAARVGRGAFLDRTLPAMYAAPVFFHYLDFVS
jgi:phosphatidate cytidylyltransferase